MPQISNISNVLLFIHIEQNLYIGIMKVAKLEYFHE